MSDARSAEVESLYDILEGINSLIKSVKDSAKGLRSTKKFITTIYLRTAKLKLNLPHKTAKSLNNCSSIIKF